MDNQRMKRLKADEPQNSSPQIRAGRLSAFTPCVENAV